MISIPVVVPSKVLFYPNMFSCCVQKLQVNNFGYITVHITKIPDFFYYLVEISHFQTMCSASGMGVYLRIYIRWTQSALDKRTELAYFDIRAANSLRQSELVL